MAPTLLLTTQRMRATCLWHDLQLVLRCFWLSLSPWHQPTASTPAHRYMVPPCSGRIRALLICIILGIDPSCLFPCPSPLPSLALRLPSPAPSRFTARRWVVRRPGPMRPAGRCSALEALAPGHRWEDGLGGTVEGRGGSRDGATRLWQCVCWVSGVVR